MIDDPYKPKPRISEADQVRMLNDLEAELSIRPVTANPIVNDYGDYIPSQRKVKALVMWAKSRKLT